MATNDKRKFELGKGGEREFDFSKGSKRKFDLTKDHEDVAAETSQQNSTVNTKPTSAANDSISTNPNCENGNSSKKWIIGIIIILVIGLIAWWLTSKSQRPEAPTPAIPEVETEPNQVPDDSMADETSEGVNVPDATEKAEATAETDTATNDAPTSDEATQGSSRPDKPIQGTAETVGTVATDDIETEALNVIRGKYGNNPDRKNALGSRYNDIQTRVNQLMK